MTAPKPPDNKTLVGMPSDLKAVLEKLDRGVADQPTSPTLIERPRSQPPPLPSRRTQAVAPPPAQPAASPAAAAMDRTLIGMPSDMQAALQRAVAEQRANTTTLQPTAAARAPRMQPAMPAQPRPSAGLGSAHQPAQPTAAVQALRAQPVRAIGVAREPGSESQAPAASRTPAVGPSSAMPVLAPQAPLDWPPAARRSDSGLVPRQEELGPAARVPADAPQAHEPLPTAPAPSEMQAMPSTRLARFATGLLPASKGYEPDAAGPHTAEAPRLALPLAEEHAPHKHDKKLADAQPKRWPAISLIVLAVVAFGAVIVLRAPHLLPGRLAALLAPEPTTAAEGIPEAPSAVNSANSPPSVNSDTSAATDLTARPVPPSPTRPLASPALTSGTAAQLEKQAIERLIANDYPAAKQAYEKLHSLDPARAEFGVMVELLRRNTAAP